MLEIISAIIISATNCVLNIVPHEREEGDEAEKLAENRRKLLRAAKHLKAKRDDIEKRIEENNIMRKTTNQWHNWVKEVDEIGDEVKNLEIKYKKARKLHYITCSSRSRAKLSRAMATKADDIDRLANLMNYDMATTERKLVASENQSFRKEAELSWVQKNVDRILRTLKDETVKRIGVWAFAGMGKTTIMESLKDKVRDNDLFEHVFFVTVQDGEERTKQSILEQLNLKLNMGENRSSHQAQFPISVALERKKYLLILDQVSQVIDLKKLGIHEGHMYGKVVVATRYKAVCDKMKMDDSWELEQMSEDDAWILFRQIAGKEADYVRIKPEAKLIVKECGGVPLLISAVATYLKGEDNDHVWSDCLWKLQSSTYDDLEPFGESHNVFKLVYNSLKDYRKKCFLYGALYPHDHEIYEDHLMECWRAEQFIPAAGRSNDVQVFKRTRLEGHATMKCLVDACLLKRCRKVKYVTMPSLFRTWALKTDEGVSSLVKPNNDLEKRHKPKWISVKSENLSASLQDVNFDIVTTLFLQRNEMVEQILDQIFVLKSKLRVLDLGYTGIRSLPESISNLRHLKALYLNNCSELSKLPADIANLRDVEILDICQTGISHWPDEIGSMVGLRCLRVSFIRNAGKDKHAQVSAKNNVIGRLFSLEELTIVVDDDYQNQWNGIYIDEKWNNVVHHIIKEVAELKFLTTLSIYFPSVKCLEDFINCSKSWKKVVGHSGENTFRSFKIIVGSFWRHQEIDITEHKAERHLKFFAYNEFSVDAGTCTTISKVLKQACTFELIGHRTIANLSRFGINSMTGLKICAIKDCSQMSSVICGTNEGDTVLEELKQLHLINLRNLTLICNGLVAEKSFANLTTLKINNCQALSAILSGQMIQRFTSLEHLRVENCSTTTVIIKGCNQHEIEENSSPSLPRLKTLELINLPTLQNICQNVTLKWSSLRTIEIDQCLMLQNFSLILSNADNLRLIRCQNSWWNQLNLDSDIKSRFTTYCQFISSIDLEINAEEIPRQVKKTLWYDAYIIFLMIYIEHEPYFILVITSIY